MAHLRVLAVLSILAGAVATPSAVRAAEITWFAGDGVWNVSSNWFPFQLPAAGDLVWVKSPKNTNKTVTYASALDPLLGDLRIDTQGNGVMTFVQGQDSLRAAVQYIGVDGDNATYRLSGGSNTVTGDLSIAHWGPAEGRYEISGTGALSTDRSFVGNAGDGVLVQTGGSHAVARDLVVALWGTSQARYELGGTGTVSCRDQAVGQGGDGVFVQSGGTNTVTEDLRIAWAGAATGRYELSGGSLGAANVWVGLDGDASFVQTGGSVYTPLDVVVANGGASGSSYRQDAGTISARNLKVGVWGDATFTQTGGTNTVRNRMVMGDAGTSVSRYDQSGGDLTSAFADFGVWGDGVMGQTGGSHVIAGKLQLGYWGPALGRYDLGGTGSFEADTLDVGILGTGIFTQTGGHAYVPGHVTLAVVGGSSGLYWLRGGTLETPRVDLLPGGTLHFDGGTLDAGTIDNLGTFRLTGGGPLVVPGTVINNGLVEVTDTEVYFASPFTNSEVYESLGASTNRFFYLSVGAGGAYLVGGPDSVFHVEVSFLNASTTPQAWDTDESELLLDGPGGHILRTPAADLGPTVEGYGDNFAWGRLTIAAGDPVSLQDGNATPGAALYVGILDLQGGVGQAASITGNGIDVYYDPQEPENAYLAGGTYPMTGGGEIRPILPLCQDGQDNDDDGLVDYPNDPGCLDADSWTESPACDDGSDNDLDGFVDWDGGGVGDPDPDCVGKPARNDETPPGSCGVGLELAVLVPAWWRVRRRRG